MGCFIEFIVKEFYNDYPLNFTDVMQISNTRMYNAKLGITKGRTWLKDFHKAYGNFDGYGYVVSEKALNIMQMFNIPFELYELKIEKIFRDYTDRPLFNLMPNYYPIKKNYNLIILKNQEDLTYEFYNSIDPYKSSFKLTIRGKKIPNSFFGEIDDNYFNRLISYNLDKNNKEVAIITDLKSIFFKSSGFIRKHHWFKIPYYDYRGSGIIISKLFEKELFSRGLHGFKVNFLDHSTY